MDIGAERVNTIIIKKTPPFKKKIVHNVLCSYSVPLDSKKGKFIES